MALPLALASIGSSIAGGFVAGLVQFFTTRAGTIIAGLGLTFIGVKSFQAFMGFVISDIQLIVSAMPANGGGGSGIGLLALQVSAYIGLFDAVNIVVSGYMSAGSLLGMKIVMGRMSK